MHNQLAIHAAHAIQLYKEKTNSLDSKILTSKDFIDFCQEHRILSRMEKILLPYFSPGNEKDYFISRITADRTRALKQIAAFNIIAKAFNENNITWLSFKGPVLSYVLFGDATIRSSKDIDIWVPKAELKKAHDVLMKNGFLLKLESDKNKHKIWHTILQKDDTYLHQSTGVELELHWHLIPGSHFTDKLIVNYRKSITFYQENIPIFSEEMEFIYVCAHAGKSHWQRLSWLFDIYDYSQKIAINKDRLLFIAKQHRLNFYLQNSLSVMKYLFQDSTYEPTKTYWLIEKINKKNIKRIATGTSLLGNRPILVKAQELMCEAILARSSKNFMTNISLSLANQINKYLR